LQNRILSPLYVLIFTAVLTLAGCGGSSFNQPASAKVPASTSTSPGASGSGSSGSATPTSGMTVLDHLQSNNWLTCGNCGNTNATGAVAGNSFQTSIGSPSESGAATLFSIVPAVANSNTYWYQQQSVASAQINALVYQFDFYIPVGMENAPQALEFECQQQLGGWVYNFAWQADYASHTWRMFNYGAAAWDSANISFQNFAPGSWHHVVAEYHNDISTHSVYHDALTIDGTRYAVNARHAAFSAPGFTDKFTNAFQLDSNGTPASYSVYVDAMKVSYR